MSLSLVKDFNQFKNIRWVKPPNIYCIGKLIYACGIIKQKNKLNVLQEFFYGYEPIAYLNDKVVHWNIDFSRCFTYESGKSVEYIGPQSVIIE